MDFQDVIRTRRDAQRHSRDELEFLARGAADGSIPDYQLTAWLMAAYLNPLSEHETVWLTLAMAHSGERIDLTGLPKPWLDKHSTGGVGDKTSLVVLPLLASCGLSVVKMSGRGLGITGGTIDKLESLPGFRTDLGPSEMKAQALRVGVAVTGATPALAPADKVLYGLRDATTTVGSLPLIVSSILSKKIAGGADTVMLDVKCGSGAFMKSLPEAQKLAEALRRVANLAGLRCRTEITDMDQPLGAMVGNALEVREAIAVLTGTASSEPTLRFESLCLQFAGSALEMTGKADSADAGLQMAKEALTSGRAYGKFLEWVAAQGYAGTDPLSSLSTAAVVKPVVVEGTGGWIGKVDAETIGQTVVDLGGGRKTKADHIDHSVGVEVHVLVGSQVRSGQPLFTIHARDEASAWVAEAQLRAGCVVSDHPVPPRPLFLGE